MDVQGLVSQDAERAVVGCLLLGSDAPDLSPDDFQTESLRTAYRTCLDLQAEGTAVDPIVVSDRSGVEKDRLLHMMREVVTTSRLPEYAVIVKDRARRRRVIDACQQTIEHAWESDASEAEGFMLGQAMSLSEANHSQGMTAKDAAKSLAGMALDFAGRRADGHETYIHPPGMSGVPLLPTDILTLGASPGAGKTSVVAWWVDEWSKRYPVLFFEYEMSEEQVWSRIQSRYSNVSMLDIVRGVDGEQMESVLEAARQERDLVFAPAMDAPRMLARLRRFAKDGGKIAVLDHYGLIPHDIPRGMNEFTAFANLVMHPLKQLAKDTGLIIVGLSQIDKMKHRKAREGKYPWPTLADLQGSSGKEQDSSAVVVLHKWPEFDDESGQSVRSKLGISETDDRDLLRFGVEKNRWGSCHHVNFLADLHDNTFERVER